MRYTRPGPIQLLAVPGLLPKAAIPLSKSHAAFLRCFGRPQQQEEEDGSQLGAAAPAKRSAAGAAGALHRVTGIAGHSAGLEAALLGGGGTRAEEARGWCWPAERPRPLTSVLGLLRSTTVQGSQRGRDGAEAVGGELNRRQRNLTEAQCWKG